MTGSRYLHTGAGMNESWRADAACRGLDPNLFHPDLFDHSLASTAKAVCAGCPVKADCLAYALDTDQVGIWGGLTTKERQRLRRRRRAS